MFAIVESGSITSMPSGKKGIKIGDNQYPVTFFTSVYSEAERNAAGVYTVEIDETNKKDGAYYQNTAITYSYDSSANKVKGTYGSPTARSLTDVLFTQADQDAGKGTKGELHYRGLKYLHKEAIEIECNALLAPSDWRVVKQEETGSSMDSGWKTWRANMRAKCNTMQTAIDNAADVEALMKLYIRDESGVRPLGDFPTKE